MASWNVRSYRAGDEAGINDLFNAVFERRRPLEAWRWKFDRNPATKEKVIAVAEDGGGKIIGVYAAMPMRFQFGDRTVLATQPVDNCIAAEYRGGGRVQVALYREYVRRMREIGAGFGFGFPNEVAYPVGKRLLKYVDLTTLVLLDRRLSFRQAVSRRTNSPVMRGVATAVGTCLIYLDLARHRLVLPRDLTVVDTRRFGEEFDAFWARNAGRTPMSPIRDRAYLEWRYAENPEGGFRILRAARSDRLVGYLVGKIREEPDGVRVGYVLDAAGEQEDVLRALLCRVLEHFRTAGVAWARGVLLPHRMVGSAMAAMGFRREAGRMPAVYVIYDETLDVGRFAERGHWDLTLGDTDIFTEGT